MVPAGDGPDTQRQRFEKDQVLSDSLCRSILGPNTTGYFACIVTRAVTYHSVHRTGPKQVLTRGDALAILSHSFSSFPRAITSSPAVFDPKVRLAFPMRTWRNCLFVMSLFHFEALEQLACTTGSTDGTLDLKKVHPANGSWAQVLDLLREIVSSAKLSLRSIWRRA